MYSFGCIESTYNPNDNIFSVDSVQIPNEYTLRDILPVQNQGNIGACVSYVATEMLNFYSLQRNFVFKPDWTEFYYDRKNKEYDGMMPREAFEIMVNDGRIKSFAKINNPLSLRYSILSHGPALLALIARSENYDFWNGSSVLGGHAVACVGYDNEGLILKNSWGYEWGNGGYTKLPYSDFGKVSEAWTILS